MLILIILKHEKLFYKKIKQSNKFLKVFKIGILKLNIF